MKKIKLLTSLLLSIILFSISCSSDESETSHEIIGVWQRIDVSDTFETKLTFNSDNTGNEYFHDGSYINTSNFNWFTENNTLTMEFENDENVEIQYNINGNQLTLNNEDDLIYIKQ